MHIGEVRSLLMSCHILISSSVPEMPVPTGFALEWRDVGGANPQIKIAARAMSACRLDNLKMDEVECLKRFIIRAFRAAPQEFMWVRL
jgi:hypothetical protein